MSDITYIRTQLGFLYLAAVIDLYSRKIVGFAFADHRDSAPIESFWGSLKSKCAYQPFESHQQARSEIFAYIMGFYNNTRKHSALSYLSPVQFEQQFSRDSYCPN